MKVLGVSVRAATISYVRRLLSWRLVRMGLVGVTGLTVQTIIFEILTFQLDLVRPSVGAIIGGELAILWNFLLNNYFTFNGHGHPTIAKLVKFNLVSLGSVAIQAVLIFITEQLTSEPTLIRIAYGTGVVIGFFCNYLGYSLLVWKKHHHISEKSVS